MRKLSQFERLRQDDPLTSPSGRYALGYDADGVAVLTESGSGVVHWRAGGEGTPVAGALLVGYGGELQVEEPTDHSTLWASGFAAPDGQALVVTDDGDFELLSGEQVRLLNSRTGPVETTVMAGAGPAAEITSECYLVREGKQQRLVTRNSDGSLQVTTRTGGGGWSHTLPVPLARWLEQDGTVLTWRFLSDAGGRSAWSLCLVDAEDALLWREGARDLPTALPPAVPHAYGGPALGRGARLRHQSLTSPSGSHTLVHQDDGNLVLYGNEGRHAAWATHTWWAGDGWAELTADGDLVVRNVCGTPVWSSGTAGSDAQQLAVDDEGRIALLDADGSAVWEVRTSTSHTSHTSHTSGTGSAADPGRGSVLRRGQSLRRQSLTAADGGTVFTHRDDRRLVLFGDDGGWIWDQYIWEAERSSLVLDEDGGLRVRAEDGSVALELGGPGDELVVTPGEVRLRRNDGTVVWRNGEAVAVPEPGAESGYDFDAWWKALLDDSVYCMTVIHDVDPDEALRRMGAVPEQIETGTWVDLLARAAREDTDVEDTVVAAFALGPHTLLVEENGWQGVNSPELSEGTFAVSCYLSINADANFVVFRDGAVVADHSWDNGSAEPTVPEVRQALEAMGSEDPIDTAYHHDIELLCRVAGVRPTPADVTGQARTAVVVDE